MAIHTIKYVEKKRKKGDGEPIIEPYNFDKIFNVINNLSDDKEEIEYIIPLISKELLLLKKDVITTTEIENLIERVLIRENKEKLAKKFILYAYNKNRIKEEQTNLINILKEITFTDIEKSDLKRENGNINGNTAMGTMLQYGSNASKEFTKSYLLRQDHKYLHETGAFHIHDLDFYAMGTTTCTQINLDKLFTGGFNMEYGKIREPQSIISYASLTSIVIQANQNDQHGGQSIPAFDFFLSKGVLKSYRKIFLNNLIKYCEFNSLSYNEELLKSKINEITTIGEKEQEKKKEIIKLVTNNDIYEVIQKNTLKTLERETFQAMESLIFNLNTMHSRAGSQVPFSSINFGTDTSEEGRLVSKCLLLAQEKGLGDGETPIFPILIFKVKKGINFYKEDPNYDLKRLALRVTSKRLFPNFSFLDAPFNLSVYKEGDPNTEVAYMGCRTRVVANVLGEPEVFSRGNNSFTSINLPRIALKSLSIKDKEEKLQFFFKNLDEIMDKAKEQLLDRFEYQGNKKAKHFPFLILQGSWKDGEKLGKEDKIKEVIKHGTLSIGFVGLAECLIALIGKHHGESEEAQRLGLKIIEFMRKKTDEYTNRYKLNFTLLATPAESLAGRFLKVDKKLFGKIKGVTDKEYYTNSFHVPVYYKIPIVKKIEIEAPYHNLTNAGHITYIELDGDMSKNIDALEQIIDYMAEKGIGYGSINHPIDRDPVCGYTGIIKETCPKCNRKEEDIKFIRIRRITGYLVGGLDRFNNAKKEEEKDRVKHF